MADRIAEFPLACRSSGAVYVVGCLCVAVEDASHSLPARGVVPRPCPATQPLPGRFRAADQSPRTRRQRVLVTAATRLALGAPTVAVTKRLT